MKITDKVRIGGVDYAIRYEKDLNNGDKLVYGHIDYEKSLIRIAEGIQSEQGEHQTFIHEVVHAIDDHFQLGIEEDMADKIAKGLYMVIKDNPEIFGMTE